MLENSRTHWRLATLEILRPNLFWRVHFGTTNAFSLLDYVRHGIALLRGQGTAQRVGRCAFQTAGAESRTARSRRPPRVHSPSRGSQSHDATALGHVRPCPAGLS